MESTYKKNDLICPIRFFFYDIILTIDTFSWFTCRKTKQDIIKNYNMILTTKIENNMFKQILTIEGSFYNENNYL